MCDLAGKLQLSPSGLTRRLDGLVKAGWVERTPSETDRRVMLAVLTPAGFDKLVEAAPVHVESVRRHMIDLLDRRRAAGDRERVRQDPRRARRRPRARPHGLTRAAGSRAWFTRPAGRTLGVTSLPRGFHCHVANIGVKDTSDDFVVIAADRPVPAAGVFTKSRFAGPSVLVSREHLADPQAQAMVVVSKNANVANGPDGLSRRPRAGRRRRRAARVRARATCSWPPPA